MVYTFLPFAILPIYAAAEKFDFRLLEAARDLGAGSARARSWRSSCPASSSGLLTAFLVVFIPALGSYVIPDLVGGPGGEMLGNKIAQRVFVDRNLPHASALSALLIVAVLLPMAAVLVLQAQEAPRGSDHRGGRVKRSRFPLAVTWLLLAFFYLPIAVVVVSSFNGARFGGGFEGPTLDWYRRLFEHREIWPAVVNSLVIAVGATLVSVVLGTTARHRAAPLPQPAAAPALRARLHAAGGARDPDGHQPAAVLRGGRPRARACSRSSSPTSPSA